MNVVCCDFHRQIIGIVQIFVSQVNVVKTVAVNGMNRVTDLANAVKRTIGLADKYRTIASTVRARPS